ncbi:M20 aminoacylase family protein [Defluviimonas sp. WL0075]|uniref:M20 family metallopeptidase n=1 Tax=Albidovulum sediminicola TaxID=2984331 RepID=A0ABT2YZM7_9RHOB|nr:M20 aminoacylase family protein [Defluviimonas sp. WL0075]MCV2864275.1 M20 family metallopeptidase [Defluviimonas sp. WL0075]
MPVLNRIADYAPQMREWRRWLHQHPELEFDCHETAAFVAARLREFGVDEIHEGIAKTGLVAIIDGQGEGPTIGLRADMDALPIEEATGLEHASTVAGRMHACGHDGHTTMLLGAAKYLAETRNFRGRVALIFQPAEEEGGGGDVMVREGMLDRFGIGEVYALHNTPQVPLGRFVTTPGPIMAAVDTLRVDLKGRGGHGAYPHDCIDPIAAAVGMISALQTIVSRNTNPLAEIVISVTQIHAGTASNIIPEEAWFGATIRTFDPDVRKATKARIEQVVAGHAAAYEVEAVIDYDWGYPATVNDADRTAFAVRVAEEVAGAAGVVADAGREMGAEDFSYLLEKRPGCYLFLGQGEGAGLHHPKYDFNDEAAPFGASFFARLVERAQPL